MKPKLTKTYLQEVEVLKRVLTDTIYEEGVRDKYFSGKITKKEKEKILSTGVYDSYVNDGLVNPASAETMIGIPRLTNFQECIQNVIANKVEGDIIETGVFRGGACILAAFVVSKLKSEKKVYVADSFEGLPKPDSKYPADENDEHHKMEFLKISVDEVKSNFKKYNLLSDSVCFIKGFFKDSLKKVPFKKLSVLRLDGDMYSSTYEALTLLYDKVTVGGYVIVDDYFLPACKKAVDDFREQKEITDTIERIDWTGVYWIKTK